MDCFRLPLEIVDMVCEYLPTFRIKPGIPEKKIKLTRCLEQLDTDYAVQYLMRLPDYLNGGMTPFAFSNSNDEMTKLCISEIIKKDNPIRSSSNFRQLDKFVITSDDFENFGENTNPRAVDFIIHECLVGQGALSNNTADMAVRFLIDHPKYIRHCKFWLNENDMAVRYTLQTMAGIMNYGYVAYNSNEIMVKHLLANPNKINWEAFAMNTHDLAVKECIETDHVSLWSSFNKNDYMVKWLIDHPEHIDGEGFSYNENPMAVEWLIQHPDMICWTVFSINPSVIEECRDKTLQDFIVSL